MSRRAFTLVELLVVVALITAFMGWFAWSTRSDQRGAAVRAAAEELASVLRDTRQRALREQVPFGVAFNIRNGLGTSGRVLNNRDGGHYYRVIGPAKRTRYPYPGNTQNLPMGQGQMQVNGDRGYQSSWCVGNFPDFVADVANSWRSEPYVLPPRKVRFLAIGDQDEGPRLAPYVLNPQIYYGSNGQTTYPRPWFGYYDPAIQRLYPWGGYDHAIPGSGFCYEGTDGAITGSANPSDRTFDHDWDARDINGKVAIADVDRDGDGKFDSPYEKEVAWPVWKQGEGRPVVNADWLDACLVFMPNGQVDFQEWNRARRAYKADEPGVVPTWAYFKGVQGIPDRAKICEQVGNVFTRPYPPGKGIQEVTHYVVHTGAYRITLGPDSLDDRDTFGSEEEAVDSFTPAWTVSITTLGVVTTSPVQTRRGYLASLPQDKLWPQDPADWLVSSDKDNSNPITKNYHGGWLSRDAVWWSSIDELQPMGQPILGVLDPKMLSRRVWWRK
jgi:prepilin-type N-terminal cleavage/methylation domain-containing protein